MRINKNYIPFVVFIFAFVFCGASSSNVFESVTVGFKLTKPGSWHFLTADDNMKNLKRSVLKDAEFKKLMIKYSRVPLVAISKYKEPHDDLNPSFKVNVRPLGRLNGKEPKKILNALIPTFKRVFDKFKVVENPRNTKVDGLKAGYMQIHYSQKSQDGRVFPVAFQLWVVPRGDYFFMIGAGTRQDEKNGKRREIWNLLRKVKIER